MADMGTAGGLAGQPWSGMALNHTSPGGCSRVGIIGPAGAYACPLGFIV